MSIWTDLWNLFFPHSCLLCGRQLISGERVLCLKCLSGLPRTQFHLRKDNIVECNFWGKIPVEHATSFLYYAKGGNVRQLLYELKYHGNQEVGEVMGRMMASELMCSHFFDGIDLIVPVPLHQRKKRLRGYNQSECLARGVSVVTGIPMDTKVVIRSRYTDTQTHDQPVQNSCRRSLQHIKLSLIFFSFKFDLFLHIQIPKHLNTDFPGQEIIAVLVFFIDRHQSLNVCLSVHRTEQTPETLRNFKT